MPRLRLTIAYDGTHFAGWQLQAPGGGRTVQGCLEEALGKLSGASVRVHGAGRTDSGVHALAQVAHCDVPEDRAGLPWQRALNAVLPRDMTVTAAAAVPDDFHARFSATGKVYRYTLWTEPAFILPWRRPYVWNVGRVAARLDTAAMDACAALFTGYHDFAAFQNAGSHVSGTERLVRAVTRLPPDTAGEMVWEFRAEGFLKQMVRNLTGALVAVGAGKVSSEDIRSVLTSGRRGLAPATAPASGLCLVAVEYGDDGRGRKRHLLHQPAAGQG
ncbi:tRNA pseudouridine(38-40) synthase TruA [Solidesulfovibrio sp.]|uniref:tRNA pseudouridine(38-40) synthase TruA n=1 Tax=Solidesulfovibrio sp. TaxID=2910990 RepID=UPI002604F6F8|nr:tRNA pseudouridine(38-40) synthase TruA [Solidesulfovibrio sp.]